MKLLISLSLILASVSATDDLLVCTSALSSGTWDSATATQLLNWGSVVQAVVAGDGTNKVYFATSANNFAATKVLVYKGPGDYDTSLYSLPRSSEIGAVGAEAGGLWLDSNGEYIYVYNKLNTVGSFAGATDILVKIKIADQSKTVLIEADAANLALYATSTKLSYPVSVMVDVDTSTAFLILKDDSSNHYLFQCTLGADCTNFDKADAIQSIAVTGGFTKMIAGSVYDPETGDIFWSTIDDSSAEYPVLKVFHYDGDSITEIYEGTAKYGILNMAVIRSQLYLVCKYSCSSTETNTFMRMNLDGTSPDSWSPAPSAFSSPNCISDGDITGGGSGGGGDGGGGDDTDTEDIIPTSTSGGASLIASSFMILLSISCMVMF